MPYGRFHVRSGGQDVALPPAQAAQAVGLPLADFESRMAQATQAALAAPRPAAGTPGAAPPIWQGRARHGDYAEVISRNPDGTFQVRVAGKELTRTERDVAYMTGLTKAPLYAMLTKATEGRMGANAARIDNKPNARFNARRGDRSNIAIPGGLPPGQAGEFDRARLRDESRELFGLLQAYAEAYSPGGQRQGVAGLGGANTPPAGNPSALGATFRPDGSLSIEGSPVAWADALLRDNRDNAQAALDQARATFGEEAWHLAQLAGMCNDWIRAGKPGSFVDWVHDRSTEIMESIGDAAARATPAEAARIKQALFDTWSLYFAPEGHGQTPESVFRQLTSPVQRGRLVARGTFLAEFTRQLHQAGVTGQTTETAGLLGRLKAWVQQALDGLKQAYAMARGGTLGQPLRDLMDRTEAVLQGRESALPIQPGLHLPSGPGDAFLAPTGGGYGSWGHGPESPPGLSYRGTSDFDRASASAAHDRHRMEEDMQAHQARYEAAMNQPIEAEQAAELQRLRQADETAAIRKYIETATFKSSRYIGDGINSVYELRNGVPVAYKPEHEQDPRPVRAGVSPRMQWRREVAASLIAGHLAISLVPPTAEIRHNGNIGSAQLWMENGFETELDIADMPGRLFFSAKNKVSGQMAEDWQLMEDLLLSGDRHSRNLMVKLDETGMVADLALIDNGLSLPDSPGIVKKVYYGPLEGKPIGPLNRQRLRDLIQNEAALQQALDPYLENTAITVMLARAKALLARGTYGNFTISEMNAHLPVSMRANAAVDYMNTNHKSR